VLNRPNGFVFVFILGRKPNPIIFNFSSHCYCLY
jgi:hypothetical protein